MEDRGFFPAESPDHASAESATTASESNKNIFIDNGLPLPQGYDVDMIRMLVQDPYRIYLFWELSGPGSERTGQKASQLGFKNGQIALQITRIATRDTFIFLVGPALEWWLLAEPDTEYIAEIGIAIDGHFFTIATSNRVRTPRVTLAEFEPIYAASPAEEKRAEEVLRASGFREVTVKDVRQQLQPGEREPTARERLFLEKLPADIREALLATNATIAPETLKRVIWAAPRFVISGSEREEFLESLIQMLNWPELPLGWPSSIMK